MMPTHAPRCPTPPGPGRWLFALAVPVACCAWTVTHEEVFREPREYCQERCKDCGSLPKRKFFYLFTCEYCFSHYVALFFVWFTHYRLLLDGVAGVRAGVVRRRLGGQRVHDAVRPAAGRDPGRAGRGRRAAKDVAIKERQLHGGDGVARTRL